MFKSDYFQALEDYRKVRRNGAIQAVLARLSGSSDRSDLLSYDEVRQKLLAVEKNTQKLKDIPLDAIVGSVGRYHDFTRKFLPKSSIDQNRWARVKAYTLNLAGLPPIEVYQIGEVYFVKDGNHRVSVARQMKSSSIQAYVTEVETKVELTPDITPDDLIIKSEQVRFLEVTQLDRIKPPADISATKAGAYPTLLEHIEVHRYFMGLEREQEIPYLEAVAHWYDEVFLPVLHIIENRGLLKDFPDRTVVDLYLWAAKYRAELIEELGWDVGSEEALSDLAERFGRKPFVTALKSAARSISKIIPDQIKEGPPPGTWRERLAQMTVLEYIFNDIIVAVDGSPTAWHALDLALTFAEYEQSRIHGIHIHPPGTDENPSLEIGEEFNFRCQNSQLKEFNYHSTEGEVGAILCESAKFADLLILPLNHPPDDSPFSRLGSGIAAILRNCPTPVLTVPGPHQQISSLLLLFDGSLKASEAIFIAAYLGTQYGIKILVHTSQIGLPFPEKVLDQAKTYLAQFPVNASFNLSEEPAPQAMKEIVQGEDIDLILMGGYGGSTLRDLVAGSIVDQVLRDFKLPVLICR